MTDIKNKALKSALRTKDKEYMHTDLPLSNNENKKMAKIAGQESAMTHYRFGPFITFNISFKKYRIDNGVPIIKTKKRVISLANHHDSFIYRYYGSLLTDYYDKYVSIAGISECAAAYRRNQGKSNITTAKDVFDFIFDTGDTWVFKGDFSSFFDNLDHGYLKRMVKNVLGESRLPIDWYRVINSITKYRLIPKDELIDALKLHRKYVTYRNTYGMAYFKNRKELGQYIKTNKIPISSANKVGIPQGTAISAVLANVYMIKFDEYVQNNMNNLNGMYRRYSDDFIICIPKASMTKAQIELFVDKIIDKSKNSLHLKIEKSKTKIYDYSKNDKNLFMLIGDEKKVSILSYLGFTFDGRVVAIRPKSIYKFIYKSKRNVKSLKNAESVWNSLDGKMDIHNNHSSLATVVRKDFNNKHRFTVKKRIIRGYLSIPQKVNPRMSMLSYADSVQRIMSIGGKYKVVARHQVTKQIRYNQKEVFKKRIR